MEQILAAVDQLIPLAPVLADAAYGNDTEFRESISDLGLPYTVGVQHSSSVSKPRTGSYPNANGKKVDSLPHFCVAIDATTPSRCAN